MKKIAELLLRFVRNIGSRGLLNWIPSKAYIKMIWFLTYRKSLNIKKPRTFNEKSQWLKLYDHNELYTTLVDKIDAKKYVAQQIGAEFIIPTLWEGTKPEDIPYNSLPDKFVIKCSHGSHCNIICHDKNKINKNIISKKLKKWLKMNWYWYGREWPYKNVPPRIMIEEYMEDNKYKELIDYKFYCFNGNPKIVDVCSKRFSNDSDMCETYYDENWKLLNLSSAGHKKDITISKPKTFETMKSIAQKLSSGLSFVRIDLYEINGKLFFGEITFYSANGYERFEPEEWNIKLGNMINLPIKY